MLRNWFYGSMNSNLCWKKIFNFLHSGSVFFCEFWNLDNSKKKYMSVCVIVHYAYRGKSKGMQRASSSAHEAEGDRELSSAEVRTRGRRPRILTARDNAQSQSPSAKCCELYASLHDRFRLEVCILFYPMSTWKLATWVTLIVAEMRVVGETGEEVQGEGGAGSRSAAPAGGSTVTKRTQNVSWTNFVKKWGMICEDKDTNDNWKKK